MDPRPRSFGVLLLAPRRSAVVVHTTESHLQLYPVNVKFRIRWAVGPPATWALQTYLVNGSDNPLRGSHALFCTRLIQSAALARRLSLRLQRRKEALCASRTMCERRRERLRTAESIASMRWSLTQRPESSAGASRGDGELQASLSRSCAQNTTHAAEQPRGAGDAAPLPKSCVPLSPQLATSSASLQSPRLSFECVGSMLKKQRAPRRPQGQYLRH